MGATTELSVCTVRLHVQHVSSICTWAKLIEDFSSIQYRLAVIEFGSYFHCPTGDLRKHETKW